MMFSILFVIICLMEVIILLRIPGKFLPAQSDSTICKSVCSRRIQVIHHSNPVCLKSMVDAAMANGAETYDISVHIQASIELWLIIHRYGMMSFHVGFICFFCDEALMALVNLTGVPCE